MYTVSVPASILLIHGLIPFDTLNASVSDSHTDSGRIFLITFALKTAVDAKSTIKYTQIPKVANLQYASKHQTCIGPAVYLCGILLTFRAHLLALALGSNERNTRLSWFFGILIP